MDRAERVVDVGVGVLGESAGERDVVGLLPRVEPEVLEQDNVVVRQRRGGHLVERVTGRAEVLRERAGRPARAGGRRPPAPSGRPRWDATTRRAPRSRSSRAVGIDGGDPCVVGDRTVAQRDVQVRAEEHTRAGDVAERVEGPDRHGLQRARDQLDEVDEPARVAPFVVVPADDLHRVPDHHRRQRVEGARRGRADDVGGDDRVLGVDELAGEAALGRPPRGRPRSPAPW